MGRRKRHRPEQVVNPEQQIEVSVVKGKTTARSCKETEITERTY